MHGALLKKLDVAVIYVPHGKDNRNLISCEGCIGLGCFIKHCSQFILQLLKESNIVEIESSREPDEIKRETIDE